MKKFLSLLLSLVLAFSFVSCSDDGGDTGLADAYKQSAQKFIDSGDIESAKKALEEGISATQDEGLKAMLEELNPEEAAAQDSAEQSAAASTPSAPAKPDYSKYVGMWVCDAASMDVTSSNADSLDLSIFIALENTHVNNIELSLLVSNIANNTATLAYKDSWGSSGTAIITFKDNAILFETKNASNNAHDMSFTFTRESAEAAAANANLIDNMDTSARTKLNTFLSNFSEAYFDEYPTSNEALLDFAFIHNLINSDDKVIYSGDYMGISADSADYTLNLFFGKTVPRANTGNWSYREGNFYKPAAGGESYSYFSIAKEMKKNSDGTYNVAFDIFYDSNNFDGFQSEWYSLTTAQAVARYSYSEAGTAVVREKNHNGKTVYELVSYKLN